MNIKEKYTNSEKIQVKGKFLYKNGIKLYLKGVTYGTFKPTEDGNQFPEVEIVKKDLGMMAEYGFNCIRTYTVPPKYLLDFALEKNINVMVGLPWEQHITFLDNDQTKNNILKKINEAVISCEAHPAIMCYTIGNEIPSQIVRWHGKRKIENFLKQLYHTVKLADPKSLVTYVNYPTTEYLDLSFLDFDCYNVYLETPEKLSGYLSRLHNLSGDRPLVLAEIGLDSNRNGVDKQAETLVWQTETIFGKGCAGMFVFAWTDEWWRGGFEIEDWDFGLVDRQRKIKPALVAVQKAMKSIPLPNEIEQPFISVVVCSYNGSATIRETIEEISKLNYKNFEVIVVNDGSKDNLEAIVKEYPVKLISTPNRGLSSARNTGMNAALGDIIAYIDDDAYPDIDWLNYLAYAYTNTDHASIGGPNIIPAGDGFIATCVANAPGGPVHVLVSDEIAEHIPGCNMSFKKEALKKIGGFDPIYRNAGDDVDVCWRIQQSGGTIGYHPSALVWHHRRNSFKAYWKQQKGYGKAEALLEAKWPEKYNSLGHLAWAGRIYGNGLTIPIKIKKEKIFHGTWGTSLFQSVYQPTQSFFHSIPLMPEWYLISVFVGILGSLGFLWSPLMWMWPIFFFTIAVVIIQAAISTRKNSSLQPDQKKNNKYLFFIVLLHMLQPVARLYGRFTNGLTPWRKRGLGLNSKFYYGFGSRVITHWSENWKSTEEWFLLIEKNLLDNKTRVKRGDDFADWDFEVRNGLLGRARAIMTIEEHGAGKQYLRFKCMPYYTINQFILPALLILLSVFAMIAEQYIVTSVSIAIMCFMVMIVFLETARSANSLINSFTFVDLNTSLESIKAERSKEANEIPYVDIDSNNLLHALQEITNKTAIKSDSKDLEIVE